MNITEKLLEMQDIEYKSFVSKLIPEVSDDKIIGIRTPILRNFAKSVETKEAEIFLKTLPHRYFEENNLHAFLIEKIPDFDRCVEKLFEFLPYVDNWATSDSMSPKVLKNDLDKLYLVIQKFILSGKTFTVRYGIKLLMNYYLDSNFSIEYLKTVADISSKEYYVNMMRAWYFATALAKQYDETVKFIENNRLDTFTHNKAIQKAVESFRVPDDRKLYLKALKRK